MDLLDILETHSPMTRMYVLNLDRTPERFIEFKSENPNFKNIHRLPAIDGQNLDISLLIAKKILSPPLNYTLGAVGAALSHMMFWKEVIESGEYGTIFEDDAVINKNFQEEIPKYIQSLPSDWDFILWGYNTDAFLSFFPTPLPSLCVMYFDNNSIIENRLNYRDSIVDPNLFPLFRAHGIVSYSISPKGAQKLLDYCTPITNMQTFYPGLNRLKENTGIDDMMANYYDKMQSFVSFPPLVIAKNDLKNSTIQKM
ncbi:glycosyltransferase family 25 protein [Acetobacter orientalis]|uniref:glycosyltransferase family 25 protein n=3 Tax=Acetobacter orientalis TaxID=146474 RepID=UPI00117841A3|nr:glycosyltransferase family 25 protein [Acetobacter orientalis]